MTILGDDTFIYVNWLVFSVIVIVFLMIIFVYSISILFNSVIFLFIVISCCIVIHLLI